MQMTVPVPGKFRRNLPTQPPRAAAPAALDRRAVPTAPRRFAWLFRRAAPAPSTFQRCLAVHMHFAQHPSALD